MSKLVITKRYPEINVGYFNFEGETVKEVKVSGGWYCAYDFEIFTEEYRGRR